MKHYFLFHHHGTVSELEREDFALKINELSSQWEDAKNEWGTWYFPLLTGDMVDVRSDGGFMSIEPNETVLGDNSMGWGLNHKVGNIFGDAIIGPCFLVTDEEGAQRVRTTFNLN